ncbi:MAG: hypothetical protein DRP26_01130, partial [Candidatus Zixiibacteriota bacterium]
FTITIYKKHKLCQPTPKFLSTNQVFKPDSFGKIKLFNQAWQVILCQQEQKLKKIVMPVNHRILIKIIAFR